jgi:hypothetical protein
MINIYDSIKNLKILLRFISLHLYIHVKGKEIKMNIKFPIEYKLDKKGNDYVVLNYLGTYKEDKSLRESMRCANSSFYYSPITGVNIIVIQLKENGKLVKKFNYQEYYEEPHTHMSHRYPLGSCNTNIFKQKVDTVKITEPWIEINP